MSSIFLHVILVKPQIMKFLFLQHLFILIYFPFVKYLYIFLKSAFSVLVSVFVFLFFFNLLKTIFLHFCIDKFGLDEEFRFHCRCLLIIMCYGYTIILLICLFYFANGTKLHKVYQRIIVFLCFVVSSFCLSSMSLHSFSHKIALGVDN